MQTAVHYREMIGGENYRPVTVAVKNGSPKSLPASRFVQIRWDYCSTRTIPVTLSFTDTNVGGKRRPLTDGCST